MLAGDARPDETTRRPDEKREAWAALAGLPPARARGRVAVACRVLLPLLLCGLLGGVLTRACSASDARDKKFAPANTARMRPAHHEAQAQSLIEQVRFDQKALSFEKGVTAGPGAGDLEIRFAAPALDASEHLRYRLVGFDREWQEAAREPEAVYKQLAPGRYEFEFEEPNGSPGASLAGNIAITVSPFWWRTGWFRGLCTLVLLLAVFALHKLRVLYLLRHTRKLQGMVSQTKAELTLAVKIAGDAQEALKEQALKDSLTGLWNRREIFAMLEREVCRAERDRTSLTLVMLDLDHFKNVNDSYGHLTGDEVLRETAGRMREAMRPYDFAGRYGGEEFLVVLPSCSRQNGMRRAEDFRRAMADRPVPTAVGLLAVTCSLGVASYDKGMAVEELIHRADAALYSAKRQGRNCVCAAIPKAVTERCS